MGSENFWPRKVRLRASVWPVEVERDASKFARSLSLSLVVSHRAKQWHSKDAHRNRMIVHRGKVAQNPSWTVKKHWRRRRKAAAGPVVVDFCSESPPFATASCATRAAENSRPLCCAHTRTHIHRKTKRASERALACRHPVHESMGLTSHSKRAQRWLSARRRARVGGAPSPPPPPPPLARAAAASVPRLETRASARLCTFLCTTTKAPTTAALHRRAPHTFTAYPGDPSR